MRYIKILFKEFSHNLKPNLQLFGIVMIIIPIIIIVNISNSSHVAWKYGAEVSLADCYIFSANTLVIELMLIPLMVFLMSHLFKYDFQINFVLRQINKKTMWKKQACKIFLLSILWILIISVWTYILGGFFSTSYINWGHDDSLFYLNTGIVSTQISLQKIMLYFCIMTFLKILLLSIIFQLLDWLMNKKIWGWIFLVFVSCIDWFYPQFSLIYRLTTINYYLCSNPAEILSSSLSGIFLIIAIWLWGLVSCRRKEFYSEE